jgi:hypothetical protein
MVEGNGLYVTAVRSWNPKIKLLSRIVAVE